MKGISARLQILCIMSIRYEVLRAVVFEKHPLLHEDCQHKWCAQEMNNGHTPCSRLTFTADWRRGEHLILLYVHCIQLDLPGGLTGACASGPISRAKKL